MGRTPINFRVKLLVMFLFVYLKGVRQQGPSWTKDLSRMKANLVNARAETAHEKASFKGPLRYRRCVVPASGFYEWKREGTRKTPHYIELGGGEPIGFAGLYDLYKDELLSCTILTTSPNA